MDDDCSPLVESSNDAVCDRSSKDLDTAHVIRVVFGGQMFDSSDEQVSVDKLCRAMGRQVQQAIKQEDDELTVEMRNPAENQSPFSMDQPYDVIMPVGDISNTHASISSKFGDGMSDNSRARIKKNRSERAPRKLRRKLCLHLDIRNVQTLFHSFEVLILL